MSIDKENIIEQDAATLYRDDMVKYLIIINRRRAFPDVIDGFKPIQRRLIYDMFKQGATSFKNRIKSSAIVGDTMKNFSGHGDSGTYGALEPMASWYKVKMPLIATKGNWGSIMGDGPAAARYTEAGLTDFCFENVIGELRDSKGVVDWVDNYSRTTYEPEFLPVRLPLLLINGSFGIGVGIATNIPTHNLVEVCEETRKLIKNPNHSPYLVPDCCQPCKILGDEKTFKQICRTGTGKYRVRGNVTTGEQKGHPMIYIHSLPDGVSTSKVIDKLNDIVAAKQLPMIQDIFDASTSNVDIRIKLRKGSDPNYVIQVLYTKTDVETPVSVNFQVVQGVNPKRMGYKEYLNSFIQQRATTKFRLYCNKLKDSTTRWNQLTAYIKIMESGKLDQLVKMIRKNKSISTDELTEFLIKKIKVNDLQAKFILDTNIARLSEGYYKKYKNELKELVPMMEYYRSVVEGNGSAILKEIDHELLEIEKKYGTPRLCTIMRSSDDTNIPKGTFKVIITKKNMIRKIPDADKLNVIRGDDPKFVIRGDNRESILLFDNKGKVFKLPIHKIPVTDKSAMGTDVRILCKNLTANIIAVYYEPTIKKIVDGKRKHFLTIVTRYNTIKNVDLNDFVNVSPSGLMYSKIKDMDEVTGLGIVPGDLDIIIYSKQKALRTSMKQLPIFKRSATGNKAMNTNSEVEGVGVVYPDTEHIVVITEKGRINKFAASGLSAHRRGGAGMNVIKLKPGDSIRSIFGATDRDEIRIVTTDGVIEIPVADIKLRTSVAPGDQIPKFKGTIIRCDLMAKK